MGQFYSDFPFLKQPLSQPSRTRPAGVQFFPLAAAAAFMLFHTSHSSVTWTVWVGRASAVWLFHSTWWCLCTQLGKGREELYLSRGRTSIPISQISVSCWIYLGPAYFCSCFPFPPAPFSYFFTCVIWTFEHQAALGPVFQLWFTDGKDTK